MGGQLRQRNQTDAIQKRQEGGQGGVKRRRREAAEQRHVGRIRPRLL